MAASAHMGCRDPGAALGDSPFAVLLGITEFYCSYRCSVRHLKWLTTALFAYVVTDFSVHPIWWLILARHAFGPGVFTPTVTGSRPWWRGSARRSSRPYLSLAGRR